MSSGCYSDYSGVHCFSLNRTSHIRRVDIDLLQENKKSFSVGIYGSTKNLSVSQNVLCLWKRLFKILLFLKNCSEELVFFGELFLCYDTLYNEIL